MATTFEGLFTSPDEIRSKRLDDIIASQAATARMGGSMDALLGQVAAGGYNTGALMAEGTAGMFGLTTPEESKAMKLQKLMTDIQNSNDPDALLGAAAEMNKMGMTREAVLVADRARKLRLENSAEARAVAQDKRAEAQNQREEAFQPYRVGQAQAGIDASKTSTARNIQAMTFAGDAEAERLKGVARDDQERGMIDSVPVPKDGNFVNYYTTLADQARNANPPRGDLVLKYTDLAEKAKKERYKIVNVPVYQNGMFMGNQPYVIDMNGVKEGPIAGASTTTEGAGAEANEPPVVIDLGGTTKSGAEGLPLPPLTPDSQNVLPMLEDYSRNLGVSPDSMAEIWKKYTAFASSPYYKVTGSLNFLDWIKSNPAILAVYK